MMSNNVYPIKSLYSLGPQTKMTSGPMGQNSSLNNPYSTCAPLEQKLSDTHLCYSNDIVLNNEISLPLFLGAKSAKSLL